MATGSPVLTVATVHLGNRVEQDAAIEDAVVYEGIRVLVYQCREAIVMVAHEQSAAPPKAT